MPNPILPSPRHPYTDDGGRATNPFHAWCSAVDRALQGGTLSLDALAAQFAALAAEFEETGSGLPASTTLSGGVGIGVSGSLAAGAVVLSLNATLDDLSNVTVPTPVNGDALVFNGSAWVPGAVATTQTFTRIDGNGDIRIDGNGDLRITN